MILLNGFYVEKNAGRRGELLECLRRNCALRSIEEVHLLLEDPLSPAQAVESFQELRHPKVRLVPLRRRGTFHDYFSYASRHCRGRATILANADIYFDSSLDRLAQVNLNGKMLCLSRWDILPDGAARFFEQPASQDAWIFVPPVRIQRCGFFLGTPGCDGRVAWEARDAGLQVSNPARTIRANHLHVTTIRHYTESQRLGGNYHSIDATFLETPWIWFTLASRNRLKDVQQNLPALVSQENSTTVVLDYGCEQGTGAWIAATFPQVRAAYAGLRNVYDGAVARNAAVALADDDAILCLLDADMRPQCGLSRHLLNGFEPGTFLVPDRAGAGYDNMLVVLKRDFEFIGGLDVAYRGVGLEVVDMRARLEAAGLRQKRIPADLLQHCPQTHADSTATNERERNVRHAIHQAYRRAKHAIAAESHEHRIPQTSLGGIYSTIAAHHWEQYAKEEPARATTIGFRENMGYAIASLEHGTSSHQNLRRPFVAVDDSLRGRQFTQVVASRVSPVELHFLTPGRVYVLVGTDWDGQWPARRWLREHGSRAPLPPATTAAGTEFEVWSLGGDAGDQHTIPTQVMLVADRLLRI